MQIGVLLGRLAVWVYGDERPPIPSGGTEEAPRGMYLSCRLVERRMGGRPYRGTARSNIRIKELFDVATPMSEADLSRARRNDLLALCQERESQFYVA